MGEFAIRGIEIHQIGVFDSFSLTFPEKVKSDQAEIHIFTGMNGSGKSTLLHLLACIVKPFDFQKNYLFDRIWNIATSKFTIITNEEAIPISFLDNNGLALLENTTTKRYEFENSIFGNPESYELEFCPFAYSGNRTISHVNILGNANITGHPLDSFLDFEKSINPNATLQWIANLKYAEYKAIATGQMNSPSQKALNDLQRLISEIVGMNIKFETEENPIRIVVELDSTKISFNALPDGLKSIISWIADLMMRMQRVKWKNNIPLFERRFVLFLDEIEVHLHPAWQRKVLPIIQKLFVNAQIFISTHSPFVVGSVDGAWVYKLQFDGKKTTVDKPVLSEDANSIKTILAEIFGVEAQFGPQVEADLDEFYALKNKALRTGNHKIRNSFFEKGNHLLGQSSELDTIIQFEFRQFNKQFPPEKSLA